MHQPVPAFLLSKEMIGKNKFLVSSLKFLIKILNSSFS